MIHPRLRRDALRWLDRLRRSPWLHPLNHADAIDDWLSMVDPIWSLGRIRARVVATIRETANARTLLLRPNALWPGHRPGQHVPVQVEFDGRRHTRVFSLSAAPRPDGLLAITVKQHSRGFVSAWWNRAAAVGDIVTLGRPRGDFILPNPLPARVLMLTAGSGITPVMAMLRELQVRCADVAVRLVHSARDAADVIFADDLARMARSWPALAVDVHLTRARGRMGDVAFSALAAEHGANAAFVCGPTGFAAAARAAWERIGALDQLRSETFGPPALPAARRSAHIVRGVRSGQTFSAQADHPLLTEAEAAGLTPAFGCRAGICHACKCRKLSGAVVDLRTGQVSDQPDELIQLCVSAARSEVALDL